MNAPDPVSSLAELSAEQVEVAMDAWRIRMNAHAGAACLHLIVNEGREAGASLPHTHAQLYALPFVPAAVARERERFTAYSERTRAATCSRICSRRGAARDRISRSTARPSRSARSPRACRSSSSRAAPARARFEDDGPLGAALLHDVLGRLGRALGAVPPFNLWVRTAPSGAGYFCWRIDLLPRLTHLAGLELGTGVNLNIMPPELAAARLREA